MSIRLRRQVEPAGGASRGQFWAVPLDQLLLDLQTGPDGLSNDEAALRLRRAGRVAPRHHRTELVILLRQFSTPITLILIAATVLSAALGEFVDAVVILSIVVLSGLLSFWQESVASRAMDDLLKTVEVTVEVRRDGKAVYVQAHEIVPGDVVMLDTGDLIPGDCRLVEANDLLIDEAALTGESYPNEKTPGTVTADAPMSGRENSLFLGTHVVRGRAQAVVVHVGGLWVTGGCRFSGSILHWRDGLQC